MKTKEKKKEKTKKRGLPPAVRILFRDDLAGCRETLEENLNALRQGDHSQKRLGSLWETARRIKGSAHLAHLDPAVQLAEALEGVFARLQEVPEGIEACQIDLLMRSVEGLRQIAEAGTEKKDLDPGEISNALETSRALNEVLPEKKEKNSPLKKTSLEKKKVEEKKLPEQLKEEESLEKGPGDGPGVEDQVIPPMRALFLSELRERAEEMTGHLLEIEQGRITAKRLETVMRLAHTIKGGARLSELDPVMKIAHVMEDLFVAVRKGNIRLESHHIDRLLQCVDAMLEFGETGARKARLSPEGIARASSLIETLQQMLAGKEISEETTGNCTEGKQCADPPANAREAQENVSIGSTPEKEGGSVPGRVLKISAESMDRVIGISSELSVEAKQTKKLRDGILSARRKVRLIAKGMAQLKTLFEGYPLKGGEKSLIQELVDKVDQLEQRIKKNFETMEYRDSRMTSLSQEIFNEALSHKMRPFREGVKGLHRLVRDVSHTLGKKVILELSGEDTRVDRDILENLNVPLTHILQNAIDHGIEPSEQRIKAGKSEVGKIRLDARHQSGMLSISIEDDGRGIELERVRKSVVEKKLVSEKAARALNRSELFEFLLLPNFTLKDSVSTVSGRGVGMNIVQDLIQKARGKIHIASTPGKGTRMELILPVALSIVNCIIIEVAREVYALPVSRVVRVVKLTSNSIQTLENRQYFMLDAKQYVGLVDARQILEVTGSPIQTQEVSAVILGQGRQLYGLAVDRILYETDLVQRPLDPRLGKVQDVSAAAFLVDGTPVLILDTEDLIRSIEKVVAGKPLQKVRHGEDADDRAHEIARRILVVDDSITVRTIESNLLKDQGYEVDVAVDGAEAWNAVRVHQYDLVLTDIDMPRMDGIALVSHIRNDSRLAELPVIVVSYKDREEDRLRGMEAGADMYLTKGSFQDNSFVKVVADLIGEAKR